MTEPKLTKSAAIMPFLKVEKSKGLSTVPSETGTFTLRADGVYFSGFSKDGQALPEKRICATLRILGETRNQQAQEWGRLLEWQDNDGNAHRWAMPMSLLAGDGAEVSRELLRRGLVIAPGKSRKVLEYIQACDSISRMTCTDKTGWHGGAFVLPDRVYGEDAQAWIYQQDGGAELSTGQLGSLDDWRTHIASLASGNSRLIFAISTAFAGSLVYPAGLESGCFHIHGGSSSGKSTAQIIASSVWGSPDTYKRSWRATSNGLEGIASLHNDGCLILDEMREITGKDAGETAYMLGNGQGKTRSDRNGGARIAKTWRLLFLSSGEVTLSEILKSEGRRVYAGQEVRIADIPADAGAGLGIFEHLHSFTKPAQLADQLRYQASQQHGTVGATWLNAITQDYRKLWDELPERINRFCAEVAPNATGQAHRVARRFGLVAIAGELATDYGLTGWKQGDATTAATRCFHDWLQEFGNGNREQQQILTTVQAYIDRNSAKFANAGNEYTPPIPDMLGYFHNTEHGREYLIFASQFERICEGHSTKQAIAVLMAAGWLKSKDSERVSLPELGRKRIYRLAILDV
ncbi:MAG TPA: DUF927 domain-containing protein [Thiolinea sp.]|nr:DUF927 domain-containing protein [Thiolinea sp.]